MSSPPIGESFYHPWKNCKTLQKILNHQDKIRENNPRKHKLLVRIHLAITVVRTVVVVDNLLTVDSVHFKVILRDQALHLVGIYITVLVLYTLPHPVHDPISYPIHPTYNTTVLYPSCY